MYALRLSHWWLAGGVALVLLVIWGSVTPADSIGVEMPSDKLVHLLSYFILMSWFGGLFRRAAHWRVALALCLLGIGLEGLQQLGGSRHGDVADMIANAVGVAAGLLPGLLIPGGWCSHVERVLIR